MPSFLDSMDSFGGAQDTEGVSELELKMRALEQQHGPMSERATVQIGLPPPPTTPQPQQSLAMQAESARMDAYMQHMEAQQRAAMEQAQAQMSLMNEARTRFAKAALYEQIIEGQLFEGDDDVTVAVEEEFRAFAEERLMVLLGIQAEKRAAAEEFLDEDEKRVIKLFAAKMLGRQASIPKPEGSAPQLAAPKPVPAAPAPGVLAAPKRGRGRPPGTGKNQRAAAAATQQRSSQPFVPNPYQQPMVPRVAPVDPNATQQVVLPNGQVRLVGTEVGQVKPPPSAPKPVPMPGPDGLVASMEWHARHMTEAASPAFSKVITTTSQGNQ